MQDKHIRKLAKHYVGKALGSLGPEAEVQDMVMLLAAMIRLIEDQRDYLLEVLDDKRS